MTFSLFLMTFSVFLIAFLRNGKGEISVNTSQKKNIKEIFYHHVATHLQLENNDFYGKLRSGSLPDSTLRIVLHDPAQTWVHINMENGKISSVMDRSRRVYRWLFNGLHSLDFPGLANHHPLWDIVILMLLTLGFVFSVIGVVIGWRRIFN